MVYLFWPAIVEQAGFGRPDAPPTFLNLEAPQYYMAYIVRPLLKNGLFGSVTIDRNRIYSQIIDNLNKAAVVGFPYQEIGERLKSAWSGEPGQSRVYEDVPVSHDLLAEWLPLAESCLVIYDSEAGYRRFLGADPVGAHHLIKHCTETFIFKDSYVTSPE